jgi:hypothetical protein
VPALNSRVCGFVSTNQLNKMAADRALIEAARGLITCQTLSRLVEMIHMMLYVEESKGLDDPRGYLQDGPRAVT